jgi:autotransporter-associated beta strand protein
MQLTWDPLGNGGNPSASGLWDISTANWNSNGIPGALWVGSPTTASDGAIFGGADGSYVVSNGVEIAFTNLTFLSSGYFFTNAAGLTGPGLYGAAASSVIVGAGKTVTFDSQISGPGNGAQIWECGSGAIVNLLGGDAGNKQPQWESTNASGTFYLNGTYPYSVMYVDVTVYQTNGTVGPISGGMNLGRPPSAGLTGASGAGVNTGIWIVSGTNSLLTTGTGSLNLARGGGLGTLIISNGAIFQTLTSPTSGQNDNCTICVDNSVGEQGLINLYNGTMNVGSSGSTTGGVIAMMPAGASTNTSATLIQSGGVINAWGGIFFGENTVANYPTGCYAAITNSGGTLYIGAVGPNGGGIKQGTGGYPTNFNITFSGGTIGANGNWTSPLPITLATLNGNITFQCADSNQNFHNITLTGPLTGAGGLNVTGGGVLTLSGSNTYAGTTVLSNGTLAVTTSSFPTNSTVTVDGSTGSAILSVTATTATDWTITGLTYQNGTPTADFNFGSLAPSTTLAPLQVNGNVSFTTTPNVTIEGTALSTGTYPLIQYTGTLSGTPPPSVTTPAYCSGYVTNSGKKISLVITSSTVTPALSWAVGNGIWDINTTASWKGEASKYTDGSAVIFDDSASGTSPITVTLNTTVNPQSVAANNTTKKYTITGTGSIAGPTALVVQGGGSLTLAGTNTYTGGTTLASGQLNINNGGDSTGSAIGIGPLTVNAGASIDNTSGSNITLQPSIQETWNGNFTYLGSSNSFNTGAGSITMNGNVTIAVSNNDFIVGGSINDFGNNYIVTKSGPGALTLPTANSFGGGFTLLSGLLNLGDPNAVGQGNFTIDGGSIDNISGAPLTLALTSYTWYGPVTYLGTTSNTLDFAGTINCAAFPITLTIVSNTFECDGDIVSGNQLITKAGQGTLYLGGATDNNNNLEMAVTAGEVIMARLSGFSLANRPGNGLTVESNALVLDAGNNIPQIGNGNNVPVLLESGGVFDINGNTETVDELTMNGGILRNGNSNTQSTLSIVYSNGIVMLEGTSNQFAFAPGASLLLNALVTGTGSLVVNGMGELNLSSNNTYTGQTTIQSGALGLPGTASISNTSNIFLAGANSALDLSQNATQVLNLGSGQTLSGFGVVTGLVAALSGSTVAPGSSTQVGTLTVTGNTGANTLTGNLVLSLNRTNAQTSSKIAFASGTVTYGGALTVSNIGPALQVGDVFHLFPSAVTTFSTINLPAADANLYAYTWKNNVAVDGTVTVTSATATINPNAGPIQFNVAGNTLSLGWPTNQGWVLQTNSVGLLNTNAWYPYPGSGSVTNVSVTIGQSQTNVFFRLAHP